MSPPSPQQAAAASGPSVWQEALARGRDRLNERVAAAIALGADPEQLRAALRQIGPSVDQHLCGMPPARLDDTADVVVAVICDQDRRGGWTRHAVAPWVIEHLALPLAPLLAELGGSFDDLLRAAERIWGRAELGRWADLLRAAASAWTRASAPEGTTMSRAQLQALGAVAAWRAGDVRLRAAALQTVAKLPTPVAAAVLDLVDEPDLAAVLAANVAAPQSWPGVDARRIGGQLALGGCFTSPPRVVGGDGLRWAVEDGEHRRSLIADAHGWLITDLGADEPGVPALKAAGDRHDRWTGVEPHGNRIGFSPSSFHVLVGPAR